MPAGKRHYFGSYFERLKKGEIDLENDTLVAILVGAGWTPDQSANANLADIVAQEIADAGYARQTLANVAVTRAGLVTAVNYDTVDFGDAVNLTAKYVVVFDDTHANDALLWFADLDTTTTGSEVSSTNSDFDINTALGNEVTATPETYAAGN